MTQLQPYERHMACLLSGLLIGLTLVVFYDHRPTSSDHFEEISIFVVGAVDEAHVHARKGATVEDLFQSVHLHLDADTSELDGMRRLNDGEVVVIPKKGMTTVYVTGAVEESKVVIVPKETGPETILQCVCIRADADRASFLRRKKIKNGEVIRIRSKKALPR